MPRRTTHLLNCAAALGVFLLGPAIARGATLYVDGQITSASCTTYAPAARSCSGGSARAYRTLSGGASAAVAGDTVYLRGGTYAQQFSPANSGTASQPITFAAYPGESPTLSGVSSPALWLIGRSYIVVDGLTVSNVGGWGRLEDATNNTIRNCTFTVATIEGTTGGLKLVRSTYNKILDNTFDDGNDNITIQESDRNVFQGNTVSTGRHSLLSLRCGNYNVIRGNSFSNPDQKDLEIYDCEGTSDAPVRLDATKRNLVEDNVIADTRSSSANYDYNGIQYGGQQGIVRRNVFRDNLGGALNFQYYSDESLYNNRHRVYHNTFYNNRCYGIVGNSGDASRYYDNRARNNILYRNTTCSGGATQTTVSNTSRVILADNAILTTSPGFVDEAGRDLQLASGSPMIDAAAFLTTATAAGSGTQITVADASYFFDGYGIPGELGDEVQLQGQSTVARVLAVDLAANRLTLDRSLTWTAGAGVALRYSGTRPDLGAFETGSTTLPSLSVQDVSVTEGNSGSTAAVFTVTLSAASSSTVTVSYATADGSATAGSDYTARSGSLSFSPGTTSLTVSVSVSGDTAAEGNEDFFLNLASPTNATLADGQGRATIVNDDTVASTLSIADASTTEGNSGTKTLAFAVTLSPASASTVTVSYATANGTATAGSDYVAQTGSLSFTAGQTSKTISVTVNGDTAVEANETFLVNLSGASGATIADGQGVGTITNDDAAPPPPSGSEPVVWSGVGVTVTGNSLTKTAATAWGNAGAISTQQIASGDGYVELTASETTTYRMFGLSNGNSNTSYQDIDFAIYLMLGGELRVYEAGISKGTFGTFNTGDTLRVAVVGGVVRYSKNGTVFYSSTRTPVYPLLVDTALYSLGATLNSAVIAAGSAPPPPPPSGSEPVVWSGVGVTVTGNSLTKTAATAWGNAGAISTQQIASGDGYVELTASETTTYRMFGLSNGNSNTSYEDIDFAIYLMLGGELRVYEAGISKGTFGTFNTGDTLRVAVVGGVVRYSKNGTVFYSSTRTPVYPLLVDTALYSLGATLNSAVIAAGSAPPPPPSGSEPVVWSGVGVTVTGNSLTKTAATAWGNAGAISTEQIASGDGYVELTASETTTYRMFGLSNGNSNTSYEDIDFAIYLMLGGELRVYEAGISKGTFGTFNTGDTLRVAVVGGVVKYSKNGTVFYSSTRTPVYPLLVDTALYTTGATLSNVVISGAP